MWCHRRSRLPEHRQVSGWKRSRSWTYDANDDLFRAAEVEALAADLGAKARSRVEQGDPGRVICEVAAQDASEPVVIGSHGSGILKRLLIGSTSNYVLHHAPCPVLVSAASYGLVRVVEAPTERRPHRRRPGSSSHAIGRWR